MKLAMHVLKWRPDGPLFERCIASAVKSKIVFTVIQNNSKDILKARYRGFDQDCTHVTMLDDDDETLLTLESGKYLLSLNKPALFTNSIITYPDKPSVLQVPVFINQWSLGHEKNKVCRPHATMIIEKDLALRANLEAQRCIAKNNWDESFGDYVMRLIISVTNGWHYDKLITYNWYIHSGSHHQINSLKFTPIRDYFFGNKEHANSYKPDTKTIQN